MFGEIQGSLVRPGVSNLTQVESGAWLDYTHRPFLDKIGHPCQTI